MVKARLVHACRLRGSQRRGKERLVSKGEDRGDRIQGLQKASFRMMVKLSPFKTEREIS